MLRRALATIMLLLAAAVAGAPAPAQGAALSIDIFGPGQGKVNLAFAEPLPLAPAPAVPQEAARFAALVRENLGFLPFLHLVGDAEILGGTRMPGVTRDDLDMRRFQISKVDLIMTTGWQPGAEGSRLECRVYEASSGRLVIGKAYLRVDAEGLTRVADLFCSHFMEALTGRGEFFRSRLAFSRREGQKREIWVMTPQGRDMRQVSFLGGASSSPAWSVDGRYLAFAHHSVWQHTLAVWDSQNNRIFETKVPGTTIGGMDFMPDGTLAVAMTRGNMDIFKMSRDLTRVGDTLVSHWAIDVSPSFDSEGRLMAFTSDRQGNPQIFFKDLQTGREERVTFEGKYNTSPSISPDGRMVVYSRRTDSGHRIFVSDIQTMRERQLTFGPGNDEEPCFSPDGYFVVFSSNRSGTYRLYLTTRHGDEPRMLETGKGAATHPAFGLRIE